MKLEIEIEDPQFKINDVVKVKNEMNDKHIIHHIIRMETQGRWSAVASSAHKNKEIAVYAEYDDTELKEIGDGVFYQIGSIYYTTCIQNDSYYNTAGSMPSRIRAGEISVIKQTRMQKGTPVVIDFDMNTIVGPDTLENINERRSVGAE